MAWTPESLIPSKDIDSFVQVNIDPENADPIECKIDGFKILTKQVINKLFSLYSDIIIIRKGRCALCIVGQCF